jgi:hypothetical protein
LVFAGILFIAPAVFFGFDMAIEQQKLWYHELTTDLYNKQDLLADGNLTIFAVLAKYTPARFIDFGSAATIVYQIVVLALLGMLVLYLMYWGRDIKDTYIFEIGFLISLMPLLASTGRNAFGFVQVIIFLIIFNWNNLKKWVKWLAVIGFILFGGVMHDMVGQTLWKIWFNTSLLSVGALMILAVAVDLRVRKVV